MDKQRIERAIQKIEGIVDTREPIEAVFTALRAFEWRTRPYNRHLAIPSPTPGEWADIYARVEPHAGDLAAVLAAHRDVFSHNLVVVLDGVAGLIDEAGAHGIDVQSLLRQFSVRSALKRIDRVPSKLNVFLYSWGRPSLASYYGPRMAWAVAEASRIEREASYVSNYFDRVLHRGNIDGGEW